MRFVSQQVLQLLLHPIFYSLDKDWLKYKKLVIETSSDLISFNDS